MFLILKMFLNLHVKNFKNFQEFIFNTSWAIYKKMDLYSRSLMCRTSVMLLEEPTNLLYWQLNEFIKKIAKFGKRCDVKFM